MGPALGWSFEDRLVLVLAALLCQAVLAVPFWPERIWRFSSAPQFLMRPFLSVIRLLEQRLNRPIRDISTRQFRGWVFTLLLALAIVSVVSAGTSLLFRIRYGWVAALALLVWLIPVYSKLRAARQVQKALASNGDPFPGLMCLLGREGSKGRDAHGLARAAVIGLYMQWTVAVISPLCWYLWLDLPGLCLSRLVAALRQELAGMQEQRGSFGQAAYVLDRVIQLLPAWFAGYLLAVSAHMVPICFPGRAWRAFLGKKGQFVPPYTRWPIAAAAGALDLSLGAPHDPYTAPALPYVGWTGGGRAKATPQDVYNATRLYVFASWLLGLLLLTVLYLRF